MDNIFILLLYNILCTKEIREKRKNKYLTKRSGTVIKMLYKNIIHTIYF